MTCDSTDTPFAWTGQAKHIRECETKLQLTDGAASWAAWQAVRGAGANVVDARTELDFVPDTSDFRCREAGMLLRLRQVTTEQQTFLVTLKVSNPESQDIQDNDEFEFAVDGTAESVEAFDQMRTSLHEAVGISLPIEMAHPIGLAAWVRLARSNGLLRTRALVEKKRVVLAPASHRWEASFDVFPPPVGRYLELEAGSPDQLASLTTRLELPADRLDARTYGKIIAERQARQGCPQPRVCLFPGTRMQLRGPVATA